MKKGIRLFTLLSLTFIGVILVLATSFYLFLMRDVTKQTQTQQIDNLTTLGHELAKQEDIISALEQKQAPPPLQQKLLQITKNHHLDFIVLMDNHSIRLTHPNPDKIGQSFEGGDEKQALQGKVTHSISKGSLGRSLRVFVPVKHQGKQIGVVALGIKLVSLKQMVRQTLYDYQWSLLLSLLIGLGVAFGLAYHLKGQLHNLEPKEIARLLEERNAMINETKDIVLVLDLNQNILLANHQAEHLAQQLGLFDQSLVGHPWTDLIQESTQLDFHKRQEQYYQQNGQAYFVSIAPIEVKSKLVGHLVVLKNATETLFLAHQLQSTQQFAKTLQTHTHDYLNQMHILYGLTELGEYEQLKDFLAQQLDMTQAFSEKVSLLVKNPILASFLVDWQQQLLEVKVASEFDILGEIIAFTDSQTMMNLLKIYRYPQQIFSQTYPEKLVVQLQEDAQNLILTLMIQASTQKLSEYQNRLSETFFQQILNEEHTQMHLHYEDTHLKIQFITEKRII